MTPVTKNWEGMGKIFLMSEQRERIRKIPIQAEATPKLRIGICEASVASIHKLPFLRSFLLPLSKLIFSCKQSLGSILPWYLCLKNCGMLTTFKKPIQKGTPKNSFQGVFLPKVLLTQKRSFQLKEWFFLNILLRKNLC